LLFRGGIEKATDGAQRFLGSFLDSAERLIVFHHGRCVELS
jgi:hypothetical protein